MPFESKKQSKACFATKGWGGKVDCKKWAKKTDYSKLSFKEFVEMSPPGWRGTVAAMKKHPEINNPWALSWWQKKHKKEEKGGKQPEPHYKDQPTSKENKPKKKKYYK